MPESRESPEERRAEQTIASELLRRAIVGDHQSARFTQDSPVLPSVWLEFAAGATVDLLLTPHKKRTPGQLAQAIREQFERVSGGSPIPLERGFVYNESYVVGRFTFPELCLVLLPLSGWFRSHLSRGLPADWQWASYSSLGDILAAALRHPPGSEVDEPILMEQSGGASASSSHVSADLIWLTRVVGVNQLLRRGGDSGLPGGLWADADGQPAHVLDPPTAARIVAAAGQLLAGISLPSLDGAAPLWLVSRNRTGGSAVRRSRQTVKADVAERSFAPDFGGLRWAILDSGIDATHPAFLKRMPGETPAAVDLSDGTDWRVRTRVVATYDFTRLRELQARAQASTVASGVGGPEGVEGTPADGTPFTAVQWAAIAQLEPSLRAGRAIEWDLIADLIAVPHDGTYVAPTHAHGTHVAGILAADWPAAVQPGADAHDVRGVCPTLELYDFRVLDQNGGCEEYAVLAALQFARWLNRHSDQFVLHGVNLSLSILAEVNSYACGRTPICEECERLVRSGVVTVVAAGNEGYLRPSTALQRRYGGYADLSITDPGNTELAITVGATHREHPHRYGVSYFSSRGPTGDGRQKPDLVAPGEKIESTVPGGQLAAMDGTSMAAPHVSGAAATLLARHPELIGEPERVKRILCDTATDLGRERAFQGAGLVDFVRALHSV